MGFMYMIHVCDLYALIFIFFPDAVQQQAVTEKQSRQLTPEQDALEHIKASRDKPFLEQMFIEPFKGLYF